MDDADTAARPIATLSEDAYHARRRTLLGDLTAAEGVRAEAALATETGSTPGVTMREARDAVEDVQDRLTGLEAAWARAQSLAVAAAAEDRLKQRAADAVEINEAAAAKVRCARDLQEAVEEVGRLYCEMMTHSARIFELGHDHVPFDGQAGGSPLMGLADALTGGAAEQSWVAGALCNRGLDRLQDGNLSSNARQAAATTLAAQVEQSNSAALSRLVRVIPELKD